MLTDVPLIHSQNTLAFGEMQKKPAINIPNTTLPLKRFHKSHDRNRGFTPAALLHKCQVRHSLFVLYNYLIMQALVSINTMEQPLFYIRKSAQIGFVCMHMNQTLLYFIKTSLKAAGYSLHNIHSSN